MGLSEFIHFSRNSEDQIHQWFGDQCKTPKDSIAYYSHIISQVSRINFEEICAVSELNEMMRCDDAAVKLFNSEKEHGKNPTLSLNPLRHEVYATLAIAKILELPDYSSMYIEHINRIEDAQGEQFTFIFSEGHVSPWSVWQMDEPSNRRKVTISSVNQAFDPLTFREIPLLQTISEMKERVQMNGSKPKLETVYNKSQGIFVVANTNMKLAVTDEGSIISLK